MLFTDVYKNYLLQFSRLTHTDELFAIPPIKHNKKRNAASPPDNGEATFCVKIISIFLYCIRNQNKFQIFFERSRRKNMQGAMTQP